MQHGSSDARLAIAASGLVANCTLWPTATQEMAIAHAEAGGKSMWCLYFEGPASDGSNGKALHVASIRAGSGSELIGEARPRLRYIALHKRMHIRA